MKEFPLFQENLSSFLRVSDHRVPVHDHSLRLTGAHKVVGKIIGHFILHGDPGVTGLSQAVKHFLSNEMNSETQPPQLSLQNIPDMELRQLRGESESEAS